MKPKQSGLSLVELAIALVIIGLVVGGGLMAITAQMQIQREKDARALLALVQEALYGYAQAHGRLPCPACDPAQNPACNGQELPAGGGTCTSGSGVVVNAMGAYGWLPAATLGLANDAQGYLRDPWQIGPASRLRYAVTRQGLGSNAATSAPLPSGMKSVGMGYFGSGTFLRVCSSAACTTALGDAVAVVWAPGPNAAQAPGGAGANEQENYDHDRDFVSQEPRAAGAAGGEFDDHLAWLAPPTLAARMVAAGQLP